jgi:hypothetical protein
MDIDMPLKNGFQASQEIISFLKTQSLETSIAIHSAFIDNQAKILSTQIGIK